MVEVHFEEEYKRKFKKLDSSLKSRVYKQVEKIIGNPETGKPMQHRRKGTREVYVKPFRLSYAYLKEQEKIIILDLYHKDEQ